MEWKPMAMILSLLWSWLCYGTLFYMATTNGCTTWLLHLQRKESAAPEAICYIIFCTYYQFWYYSTINLFNFDFEFWCGCCGIIKIAFCQLIVWVRHFTGCGILSGYLLRSTETTIVAACFMWECLRHQRRFNPLFHAWDLQSLLPLLPYLSVKPP